jgi:RND superfamily putative drug exporter
MRRSQSSVLPETRLPEAHHARQSPHPRGTPGRPPLAERIAGWSSRYRKTAVLGWLMLVAIVFVAGHVISAKNVPSYDPGQSGTAERALQNLNVSGPPPAESVLIEARGSSTASFLINPQLHQAVSQVVAALHKLPRSTASDIRSPLSAGNSTLISANGRAAVVTFNVTGGNEDQAVGPAQRAVAAVQASHPDLLIQEAGDASIDKVVSSEISRDFRKAETTSLPVTLVLLLAVFGALIAAGIPLLLAGTAVISAISLTSIVGQWLPTGQSTSEVVLIIGMAVGVDYSLFYLRREREERARGRSTSEALRIAAGTSGRAIVVSGVTVMIGLAGLFLSGYSVFTGIGIGSIIVVGVAVAGSLTFLPAMLSWLGTWADRGRIPFLGRRRTASGPSKLWAALVHRVVRHPAVWGAVAVVGMLALAAPALGMRLSNSGIHDLPANIPVVQNLLATQRAFPGGPAPAEVVVTGAGLTGPAVRHAVTALQGRAAAGTLLREPVTAALLDHGQVMVVSVPLAGTGTDATSDRALAVLRDQALPATLGRVHGISYAVTGETAGNHDFTSRLSGRTPLVFAFVLGLAFLLLMVSFRSVTIPLMSIALNLLSVGAAYGVVTLIFQDGHLHQQLGFSPYGGITPWLPLFMFVILFGLSMDYHVFILSRIRELRSRGMPTKEAITTGIGASAGVVTSAAVIMVSVFSIFATLSVIEFKMIGIGLATAILLDATVVRGVLMPAAMSLLGERNWYLPRWLAWLPPKWWS